MKKPEPTSVSGRELWAFLPAVYRDRDDGDLAAYLDACGELLDRVRATLDQRLADCFPESPPGERQAQGWLLPYFADLLDVRLLSPFVDGRRREVARAIAWRQTKGTRRAIEDIAEALGQLEVEVQEGWRRVAVTPRVDMTLLPAAAFGESEEPDPQNPLVAARRPGLPVATVDLGLPSRAIRADPGHPLARASRFPGVALPVTWRQLHPAGAPCFPGSYEDASRRTVDLRTPSWKEGHIHPRRVLLFVPPPSSFPPDRIFDTLTETSGRLTLRGMAVRKVVVNTPGVNEPVLDAVDCLFDEVEAPEGLVRLDSCTVVRSLTCRRLQASDCLFAGAVAVANRPDDAPGCVRYSRIPEGLDRRLPRHRTTSDEPVFFAIDFCDSTGAPRRATAFGDPGYGSLHPATPDSICFGAEDGGEMGADHHRRLSLARAAVSAKLEEFLPVGMEAVLIPDQRLLVAPPRANPE